MILAISGSLRAQSSNTALLERLRALAPAEIEIYDGLADLPHFNPDVEEVAPPPIALELRACVGAADALVISSPEYAHGVPGTLKNALDWLVGGPEMVNKRVVLINAAPWSTHAQASLKETIRTMSANVIADIAIDFKHASEQELTRALRDVLSRLEARS